MRPHYLTEHVPPAPQAGQPVQPAEPEQQRELLRRWATRYIWWKTPEEALRYPDRILAQVMNLGDYADVQQMVEAFGIATLRAVLHQVEVGQLNERSWVYWHYRLGLASTPTDVPPLPTKRLSSCP